MEGRLEIVDVDVRAPGGGRLVGSNVETPVAGTNSELSSVLISGWAVARDGIPPRIELRGAYSPIQIPVSLPRPDIGALFNIPSAVQSGFATAISALEIPQEFYIEIAAVFEDGCSEPIGRIRGRRPIIRCGSPLGFDPLMVTTIGRTGSSWFAHLVSNHDEIVAYRPLDLETRMLSYWLTVARSVSHPRSYSQAFSTDFSRRYWWLGDLGSVDVHVVSAVERELRDLLDRRSVEALVSFSLAQINDFYDAVAGAQGTSRARYFVEKTPAWPDVTDVAWSVYSEPREILLVRDFRDVVASMLSFSEKKRVTSFGRAHVKSDEDFLSMLGRRSRGLLGYWRDRRERILLVHYENLVRNPEETLHVVFSHVGVDASDRTIKTTLTRASRGIEGFRESHKTSSSVEESIGRWRRDLEPHLQRACDEAFADVLPAFGYEV